MNISKHDIRNTLLNILEYIGADPKYADHVELHSYVKTLINRVYKHPIQKS